MKITAILCVLLASLPGLCQNNIDSLVSDKIVLVNIAGLSRDEIAQLILEAEKSAPKVIGIDAWFTGVKSDTLLLPTLRKFSNIVIAVKMTNCRNGNCDSLTGQYFPYEKQGHVMVNYKTLKYVPKLTHQSTPYPFFCLALLNEYDNTIVKKFYKKRLYKKPLQFYGNYNSFMTIEGIDFLTGKFSKDHSLENKIVILGYLGIPLGHVRDPLTETDYKRSALSNGKLPDLYGVILLANILTDIMLKTQ